jgi:hypothetical protein
LGWTSQKQTNKTVLMNTWERKEPSAPMLFLIL